MITLYHPYLETLRSTLSVHYDLHERFIKDTILIKEGYASKSEFEKNRIEISIIETRKKADSLSKVIQAREEYFKKYIQQFAIDIKEMEANYETTLSSAKEKSKKHKQLDALLQAVVWEVVDTNIEAKIKLYQRLKKMIA